MSGLKARLAQTEAEAEAAEKELADTNKKGEEVNQTAVIKLYHLFMLALYFSTRDLFAGLFYLILWYLKVVLLTII